MINEQLNRILSSNLDQIDENLYANEERLGSLEQFLSAKARELGGLQRCFMQEIEEIRQYEQTRERFKRFLESMKGEFCFLRRSLIELAHDQAGLIKWRTEMENSLGQLNDLIRIVLRKEESKRLEMIRELNEEHLSDLRNLQAKHDDETEKLRKAIVYLEKELKKKHGDNVSKSIVPEIALDSHPLRAKSKSNTRSFRDLKLTDNSVSPKHHPYFQCNTPKSRKDGDVPSANRYYQQASPTLNAYKQNGSINQITNKTRSSIIYQKHFDQKRVNSRQENEHPERKVLANCKHNLSYNNTSNQSSFMRINDSFKRTTAYEPAAPVPELPDLVLNLSYTPPIHNGFDVLIQKNKEVYKGMWKRGVFEGRGKFYSDNWVYDGQFKNGVIDGLGSLAFEGCTFIGRFVNGRANGQATLYTRERPISGIWKDHVMIRQV